jgi:acetyltransferase-like isoleucine patch superfamily enzyme
VTEPLVVVGGGGMGRCVLDVIDAVNRSKQQDSGQAAWEVLGVLDDSTPDLDLLTAREVQHLGPVSHLAELSADVGYVIGIADGAVRRRVDEFAQSLGRSSPTLVHPNAHRGFGVELGPGSVVCSHVSMRTTFSSGGTCTSTRTARSATTAGSRAM